MPAYSSPTAFLRAVSTGSRTWAPPSNACTSASSSSSVGASGSELCPFFTMYDEKAEKARWVEANSGASVIAETARRGQKTRRYYTWFDIPRAAGFLSSSPHLVPLISFKWWAFLTKRSTTASSTGTLTRPRKIFLSSSAFAL